MKKSLIIFTLFFLTSFIYSINYVDISSYSGENVLFLSNVEDFQNLIDTSKQTTIYRNHGESIYFIIITDNAWYLFDTKGYENLEDYYTGNKLGFSSGYDYYFCIEHGIRDYNNYQLMNQHMFLTQEDLDDAIEKGFLNFLATKIINKFGYKGNIQSQDKRLLGNGSDASSNTHYSYKMLDQYENVPVLIKNTTFRFNLPENISTEKYESTIYKLDKWNNNSTTRGSFDIRCYQPEHNAKPRPVKWPNFARCNMKRIA